MNNPPNIDTLASAFSGGLTLDQLRERMSGKPRTIAAPVQLTEQQREYQRAYFERIRQGKKYEAAPRQRIFRQEMPYQTAREKFRLILEDRTKQIEIQKPGFKWVFSEADRVIWSNALKYFINDPSCIWPLTKGLFFYGGFGTGKTELFQMLERFCRESDLQKAFKFTSMSGEYVRARSEKEYDAVAPNVQFDRVFDEVGRYTGTVNHYGNPIDLNEANFEERYRRWQNYGQLTHIITNLDTHGMEAHLSGMLFDRIRSMCTSVFFEGNSKR